jgi:hypothetical protein
MQGSRSRRDWGAKLVLAAAFVLVAGPLHAATGRLNVSKWKGLSLAVDAQWLDSGGYRPVKVRVITAAPSQADRSFHVEFEAGTPYNPRTVIVSQELELPAGKLEAEATLRVPQYFSWQYYNLDIWEDGRYLEDLSQQRINVATGQDWSEGAPNVLIVADKPAVPPALPAVPAGIPVLGLATTTPNARTATLASLLAPSDPQVAVGMGGATPLTAVTHLATSLTLPLDQLPQAWIDYSGLDIVCLTLAQAKQMAAEEPGRWNALRAWTAAGGNLLVSGVVSDAPELAELERLLGEPRDAAANADPVARGWVAPAPESFKRSIPAPFGASNLNAAAATVGLPASGAPAGAMPGMAPGGQAAAATQQPPKPQPPVHDPPFVMRRYALGLVVAVAADDLFAQASDQWQGLLNSIGHERWVWYLRHGLSPQRENHDFWDWPIPGVGLAPVTAFQVLITAFVIGIGPLNYWWLRRRGRLHLLVLAVPLSAALVTMALFAYAVAVDGFGIRVRARSFTLLDQRTGEAACWARISYYAGLAPSGGLAFSDDVAVLPLLPQDPNQRNGEMRRRALTWSPGKQTLVSGWIASRTPTQFLTVRSRATEARLKVKQTSLGAPPNVENQLGVRIERLLIADAEGNQFRAESIPTGGAQALETASLADEGTWYRQQYNRLHPAIPPGFDRTMSRFMTGRFYRWTSPWNNPLPPATLRTSILERELEAALLQLSRMQGGQPAGLRPRSYLAIVERSPEAEYGIDSYEEAGSLHVIVGKW